jgi:predicted CxxxxCH...CXXCH cytochrome family protein
MKLVSLKTNAQHGTAILALACVTLLSGCGGGASALGNPSTVVNSGVTSTQNLSFAYFQRCINPIFLAALPSVQGGTATNTCAASGCHADATGAGGAFRIVPTATAIDLNNVSNTVALIRASDMYKNFYSAQGEVVISTPLQSRLINKPLLRGVLHGGGLIFADTSDPHIQLMTYWINNPVPIGQDEFSTAAYSMFTPADPMLGTCNTQ